MEHRAAIHFFTLKGLKAKDVCAQLESVCGQGALALPTVRKWRRRFQQGRTDLFDDPKSGRPLTPGLERQHAC
jgi:transposase